ncbi:MAG: hypothetical protein AUI00_04680 [Verrucomicrobia bacterium 13_2_20CM_2_54_15]|nr:MAG: hypothetical protein AUI00_04680 [Verrucomicrobia bacterium 13_2_20CM_2_54_15]
MLAGRLRGRSFAAQGDPAVQQFSQSRDGRITPTHRRDALMERTFAVINGAFSACLNGQEFLPATCRLTRDSAFGAKRIQTGLACVILFA